LALGFDKNLKMFKENTHDRVNITGIHYETGRPVTLEIVDGIIVRVDETENPEDTDLYIAPGLFDNQVNGYSGVDFSGDDLTSDGVLRATSALWKEGVTTYLPTLLTNSHENLLKNFRILAEAVRNDHHVMDSVPGFHLEGPYISAVEGYRGCHPLHHIRKPSWKEFMAYQEAAGGKIMQVTIAPETDGAIEFIRLCSKNGVISAIGHTNASADQISKAVDAGARLSTHLGNGCANLIHRHLNPIWPQLADERLIPSIIADGHHLLPEEIKVFYKVKGSHNMILTSDVIFLAGMAPGRYTFMESEVLLTAEGMLLNPLLNCLAGASLPLIRGVENIMAITKCSLPDAIDMASGNVSKIYNMNDRGNLVPGARADLILFEIIDNRIKIAETLVRGTMVFS
jgi:N-acetylglucosamine-6-phosphate deacetylase